MALIKCRECGKEISDRAPQCIHCGCPIEVDAKNEQEHCTDNNRKSKAKELTEKALKSVKNLDKKILVPVIAVVVVFAIIIGIASGTGGKLSLGAEKIEIGKVYKINNLGEFSIRRVNMNSNLVSNDRNTYVEFTCDFINKTKEKYALSRDTVSIYAEGKESKNVYNQEKILQYDGRPAYRETVEAMPEVKTEVTMAVVVPDTEKELIVTLVFGGEEFAFEYTVGDVVRNYEQIKINGSYEVDKVMSMEIRDVAYATYVCAPNPYKGMTHHSYPISNKEEMVYLVFDMNYTNLDDVMVHPHYTIRPQVRFDGDYLFEEKVFYMMEDNDTEIEILVHEEDCTPLVKRHLYVALKVSKALMEKEVEVSFFVNDKEFVYKGTPRYEEKYGL